MNAVAIVPILLSACLAGALSAQSVYRAQTDAVVITAAVTDGRRPVTGLTAADFEVRDNGVVQEIADFSRETLPVDLTLTIDLSGSMKPADRAVIERAIARIGAALEPRDRAGISTFGQRIVERTALQHPPIRADVTGVGQGGSAVLDALLLSLVTPPVSDRRQLVIFMTDGADTGSYFDSRLVVETAKYASARTSVLLVPNRASSRTLGVLQAVASITGGEMTELKKKDELGPSFLKALEDVRESYVIRYSPSGVQQPGWHELAVSLKSKSYRVRARQGYWR
ncbi:MAG: hypothetical protein WD690_10875 [Vicinamibacterales bacterium]